MDKTHYERRSHERGNYEIIPTYTDQEEPDGPIIAPSNPATPS